MQLSSVRHFNFMELNNTMDESRMYVQFKYMTRYMWSW